MGDQSATFCKSLFLGQAEKGEQKKKVGPKRRKTSGGGSSSAKKAKKDLLPPPPEDVVEVRDQLAIHADLPPELIVSSTPWSPTTSADILGSSVGIPLAEKLEERR